MYGAEARPGLADREQVQTWMQGSQIDLNFQDGDAIPQCG